MIEINELRVGAILSDNEGQYFRVHGIQKDHVTIETWSATYVAEFFNGYLYQLHPVSLTPEILAKCGFAKDRNGYALPETNFSISVTKDGEFLPCWYDRVLWPYATKTLQYLHQLQNLFFTLAGEELDVNP